MPDAQRIYELMILTAWADGKVEPQEALAVRDLVAKLPRLAAVANRSEVARQAKARIDEKGLDAAVREAASAIGERDDQELAFRCCAKVLGADQQLEAEEAEVLATLQELFAFTAADVKRLLAAR